MMPRRLDPEDSESRLQEHLRQNGDTLYSPWLNRRAKEADANLSPSPPTLQDLVNTRPAIPRPITPKSVALRSQSSALKRQESERRERLCPLDTCRHSGPFYNSWNGRRKRAVSACLDVRPKPPIPRGSFPDFRATINGPESSTSGGLEHNDPNTQVPVAGAAETPIESYRQVSSVPLRSPSTEEIENTNPDLDSLSDTLNNSTFRAQLEAKWILSLSMHFRDGSDREKFFVTYIERRNKWRRVTVSCDYRSAPEESLESDLKSLHYQRDKNARIYQAIRDSLPDIQFYDTVTNLKLQTSDCRLHVHVTEDVNEITKYPLLSAIEHLHFEQNGYLKVRESDLYFESHLSGFVYRVSHGGNMYIKKEISSPDTVEEFLYELNALAALRNSLGIIGLIGVVVDDDQTCIKGLLIEWASGGSLNDLLFENQGRTIPWPRRAKWARQIIAGIRDIHEAGFIQGDCTISNIVLDADDDAKIVDINRRGCPIGWEPPEFEGLIRSAQRVSMYIGVKSDLFQLGMILWAIAKQADEPEREERPLWVDDLECPRFYKTIVRSCLSENPAKRSSAKQLFDQFPRIGNIAADPNSGPNDSREIFDDMSTSRISTTEMQNPENSGIPNGKQDWAPLAGSLELGPNENGEPNYKLQDTLLAGIGRPFEERPESVKTSETPVEHIVSFGAPIHQDSGLDVDLIHQKENPDFITTTNHAHGNLEGHSDPAVVLGPGFTPGIPIHQDSGFDDVAAIELQRNGVPMASFPASIDGHSAIRGSKDSDSYYLTGDLLRGLGAHTSTVQKDIT